MGKVDTELQFYIFPDWRSLHFRLLMCPNISMWLHFNDVYAYIKYIFNDKAFW